MVGGTKLPHVIRGLSVALGLLLVLGLASCAIDVDRPATELSDQEWAAVAANLAASDSTRDQYLRDAESLGSRPALRLALHDLAAAPGIAACGASADSTVFWWRFDDGSEFAFVTTAEKSRAPRAAAPAPEAVAAAVPGRLPHALRGLVLAPYLWQFGAYDESPAVAAYLRDANYAPVDYLSNPDAAHLRMTFACYKRFREYGVIHIATHSVVYDDEVHGMDTGVPCIREYYTPEEREDERLGLLRHVGSGERINWRFVIMPGWVSKHYPGGLENSLVYLSTCGALSPSGSDNALATALLGNGSVCFGWTNNVQSSDARGTAVALYDSLLGAQTCAAAFQGVMSSGLGRSHAGASLLACLSRGSTGADLQLLDCLDISGNWTGTETASIVLDFNGEQQTTPLQSGGVATFLQSACEVQLDNSLAETFPRTGAMAGVRLTLSGPFVAVMGGSVSYAQNLFTVRGRVHRDGATQVLDLTGRGFASGTIEGLPFTCTATSSARLTRTSAAKQATEPPAPPDASAPALLTVGGARFRAPLLLPGTGASAAAR